MRPIAITTIVLLIYGNCAYALQSDSVRVYRDIAIAYIIKEHGDSAVYITQKILSRYPDDHFHHYLASNAYRTLYINKKQQCQNQQVNCDQLDLLKRQSLHAMTRADSLLRRTFPDSTFYLNAKASKYEEFEDEKAALQVYDQSLLIRENQKDVLLHLVANAIKANDTVRAFSYFDRLMTLPEISRVQRLHYIDLLLQYGHFERALQALTEHDNSNGSDLTFSYQRIRAYVGLENYEQATKGCSELNAKIARDTTYTSEFSQGELFFICGEAHYQTGQIQQAIVSYNQSLPHDTTGYFAIRLAQVFEENPAFYYEQYLTDRTAMNKVGLARERVSEFERKVEDIKRILTTHGNTTDSLLLDSLGNLYVGIGDYLNARNVYITLNRTSPGISNKVKLAIILFQLMDFDESEFYLSQVVRLMPKHKDMMILRVFLAIERLKQGTSDCKDVQRTWNQLDLNLLSKDEQIILCESMRKVCPTIACVK